MWVKNFTDKDLTLEINGSYLNLVADEVTLVPDGLVTFEKLEQIFGKGKLGEVESGSNDSLMLNQVLAETGKLYSTERAPIGVIGRLWSPSSIDVYGSDSSEQPQSSNEMSCPDGNDGVQGLRIFGTVPRYLFFSGSEDKIVLTNIIVHEIGDLS